MIQETIVTSQNLSAETHIAPMGIHILDAEFLIMPFRPSATLDNLLETGCAVINYCDDVRIFAGALTGRRDWPLTPAEQIKGQFLSCALAHVEVVVYRTENDDIRPKLYCKAVHTANHKPFTGFNRAQYSVLEAAILVSRLRMLPRKKVASEIEYLRIGLEKTAGTREFEAWEWLMESIANFNKKTSNS